jgi:hypothetical protein
MTTLPLNYDQTLEKEQQNNLVRNFARAALSCVILRTYCQNDIHKRELAQSVVAIPIHPTWRPDT